MKERNRSIIVTVYLFQCATQVQRKALPTKHEQGVVLVFSLIMLLILTLLSISMIQQNRLNFMMAGNAQTQTEEFSTAENILKLTEGYIDTLHSAYTRECMANYNGDRTQISYGCYNENSGYYDNWSIVYTVDGEVNDRLYLCDTTPDKDEFAGLLAIDNDPETHAWEITDRVVPDGTNAEVSITAIACINTTTSMETLCKDDSQRDLLQNDLGADKCSWATNCPVALYTLRIISHTNTGAERIVESKYGVRCDAITLNSP